MNIDPDLLTPNQQLAILSFYGPTCGEIGNCAPSWIFTLTVDNAGFTDEEINYIKTYVSPAMQAYGAQFASGLG